MSCNFDKEDGKQSQCDESNSDIKVLTTKKDSIFFFKKK